jgi:F-box domain
MDTLPPELVLEILAYLPRQSVRSMRTVSRAFRALVPSPDFTLMKSFLDPDTALSTITAAARDLSVRPRSIWSPHCPVPPSVPLLPDFMSVLWVALTGRAPERDVCVEDVKVVAGIDVTRETLQQALFRWVLYLSYRTEKKIPHMWIVHPRAA